MSGATDAMLQPWRWPPESMDGGLETLEAPRFSVASLSCYSSPGLCPLHFLLPEKNALLPTELPNLWTHSCWCAHSMSSTFWAARPWDVRLSLQAIHIWPIQLVSLHFGNKMNIFVCMLLCEKVRQLRLTWFKFDSNFVPLAYDSAMEPSMWPCWWVPYWSTDTPWTSNVPPNTCCPHCWEFHPHPPPDCHFCVPAQAAMHLRLLLGYPSRGTDLSLPSAAPWHFNSCHPTN